MIYYINNKIVNQGNLTICVSPLISVLLVTDNTVLKNQTFLQSFYNNNILILLTKFKFLQVWSTVLSVFPKNKVYWPTGVVIPLTSSGKLYFS